LFHLQNTDAAPKSITISFMGVFSSHFITGYDRKVVHESALSS